MPTESVSEQDLSVLIGLNPLIGTATADHSPTTESPGPSVRELNYLTADNRDLRAEVERLRAERDRLLATQRRMMDLLGTASPERLIHDMRNVLNERELFRALADTVE